MQKHKKYLVVTIWISVIAFVGAGFVGWGSYDFGSRANSVARVGEVKIGVKEFAREYERIRSLFHSMGADVDEKRAKELEQLALQNLIDQALLEQFARDHDLEVSDAEVAAAIAANQTFWKDGRFDRERYLQILRTNRLTPKEFESRVKRDLLLQKALKALEPTLYDLEFNTTASAFFVADKITYKPMSADDLEVNATDREVEAFYRQNGSLFMAPQKAKIAIIEINASQMPPATKEQLLEYYKSHKSSYRAPDGKILPFEAAKEQVAGDLAKKLAKKEALKRYIALKKGQIEPQRELIVSLTPDAPLSPALIEALKKASEGSVIKPKPGDEGYIVAKVLQKIPAAPKPFEEVRSEAEAMLLNQKRSEALMERAKKMVDSFEGITTDYICRDDIGAIKELDRDEATLFLKKLFVSTEPKGIIKLSDVKIVLFKIDDQKLGLARKIEANREMIKEGAMNLKERLQYRGLIDKLKTLYPIEVYRKGS